MIGVTDRVWVQSNNEVFPVSLDAGTPADLRIPIPDNATIALDDTSAWWVRPDSSELVRTDLDGAQPEARIRIVEQSQSSTT